MTMRAHCPGTQGRRSCFWQLVGLAAMLLLVLPTPLVGQSTRSTVVVVEITGAIGVATSEHIAQAVAKAEANGAQLLVIRLDTPGGLVSSTRNIIKTILASRVPIAVYVAPSGAHAASAGTYITLAANLAAMAPGTNIGAATPIQISAPGLPGAPDPKRQPSDQEPAGNQTAGALEQKTLNDAVAMIRGLAQLRGRNADWAEKAVREAATLTAAEALKEGVVEVVARDTQDLLRQLDGRNVSTSAGDVKLGTLDATVTVFEPTFRTKLLAALADPNIAFLLLMIGVYGILFEFWTPGLAGSGVIGAISLLLALTALTALPVNYAALGLLLLGIALMTSEAFTPGVGILGIGGLVSFVLGAVFLFDPAGADVDLQIAWPLIAGAALTSAALSIGTLGLALKVRKRAVMTGAEQMIGSTGKVIDWGNGRGRVRVHGEVWSARGPYALEGGQKVTVTSRNGLTLAVVKQDNVED
jgi:membrane-bound serine protease (ClpP class)